MATGIYLITNTINQKCYIGSAVNFKNRWQKHKRDLIKNIHKNNHLQNAYNKYGNVFIFDILANCNKEDLLYFEQKCIDLLKPEYNICKIAGSSLGVKRSAETKAKCSEAKKGKLNTSSTKFKKGSLPYNALPQDIIDNIIANKEILNISNRDLAAIMNITHVTVGTYYNNYLKVS